MDHTEFVKEFNKRVDNRYLNHVHEVRATLTPTEIRQLHDIPFSVLAATYKAGANMGLKILAEMTREEAKETIERERK